MQLIRSERPELSRPSNRLDRWFRSPFFGGRDWLSMFDWDALGDNFLPDTRLGADLYEDADAYHVRMELPGVSKDQLEVELENAVLTVSCRYHEGDEKSGEVSRAYSRSISIPDGALTDRIDAELKDGLLMIHIPKAEATKPKRIKVK